MDDMIQEQPADAMTWWGTSWGSSLCKECKQVQTPVGVRCTYCNEAIKDGDNGMNVAGNMGPYHRECMTRNIQGSVGHQKGICGCFGGYEDDPPGATLREGALAAWKYFQQHVN